MPVNPEKNAHSGNLAASGAAVEHENDRLTTWLGACPVDLDDTQRDAIRDIIGVSVHQHRWIPEVDVRPDLG